MKLVAVCAALFASALAAAQGVPPSQAASTDRASPLEAKVQNIVTEDEQVRIEELRVRGLTQRVVVKPKNAAAYEVVPTAGGRDPSQGRSGSQGAAGQRVWNLFKF